MEISKMSMSVGIFMALTFFTPAHAIVHSQQGQMDMKGMCQDMSAEMQQFADKLNMNNKMLFCSKFNDSQRKQAMQMASQSSGYGKQKMTPDKSVEKVAADNKIPIS
ncbi:MAG: hypothetical protein JSR76_02630 [Verrucomicrobia bacterium]|nr:hypothetical protein [Verrucomicrobiota bacterium]